MSAGNNNFWQKKKLLKKSPHFVLENFVFIIIYIDLYIYFLLFLNIFMCILLFKINNVIFKSLDFYLYLVKKKRNKLSEMD